MLKLTILAPAALLPFLLLPTTGADASGGQDSGDDDAAKEELAELFGAEGIEVDLERKLISIPAQVLVRNDLLEYLLVGPRGAAHESLFLTGVTPSLLNAAVLTVGVTQGKNASWEEVKAEPEGEAAEGAEPVYKVNPPEGDGMFLYVGWKEEGETYLFRVDDLVSNLSTGRSMRRHRWVFLGSRFEAPRPGEPEVFLADLAQNLINLSFFYDGKTLFTAALPECEQQTIWVGNPWLLPQREQPVRLFFAHEPMDRLPAEWEAELPNVVTVPKGENAR